MMSSNHDQRDNIRSQQEYMQTVENYREEAGKHAVEFNRMSLRERNLEKEHFDAQMKKRDEEESRKRAIEATQQAVNMDNSMYRMSNESPGMNPVSCMPSTSVHSSPDQSAKLSRKRSVREPVSPSTKRMNMMTANQMPPNHTTSQFPTQNGNPMPQMNNGYGMTPYGMQGGPQLPPNHSNNMPVSGSKEAAIMRSRYLQQQQQGRVPPFGHQLLVQQQQQAAAAAAHQQQQMNPGGMPMNQQQQLAMQQQMMMRAKEKNRQCMPGMSPSYGFPQQQQQQPSATPMSPSFNQHPIMSPSCMVPSSNSPSYSTGMGMNPQMKQQIPQRPQMNGYAQQQQQQHYHQLHQQQQYMQMMNGQMNGMTPLQIQQHQHQQQLQMKMMQQQMQPHQQVQQVHPGLTPSPPFPGQPQMFQQNQNFTQAPQQGFPQRVQQQQPQMNSFPSPQMNYPSPLGMNNNPGMPMSVPNPHPPPHTPQMTQQPSSSHSTPQNPSNLNPSSVQSIHNTSIPKLERPPTGPSNMAAGQTVDCSPLASSSTSSSTNNDGPLQGDFYRMFDTDEKEDIFSSITSLVPMGDVPLQPYLEDFKGTDFNDLLTSSSFALAPIK